MKEPLITMSFVVTPELKKLLEVWAQQDDRNISSLLRQILREEAKRRGNEVTTPSRV